LVLYKPAQSKQQISNQLSMVCTFLLLVRNSKKVHSAIAAAMIVLEQGKNMHARHKKPLLPKIESSFVVKTCYTGVYGC